jgi:hypothetical protein
MWCSKSVTVYTGVLALGEAGVFVFKHKYREGGLEICSVNIYMVVGGRTFRQDCNAFEGFGEIG